VFLNSNNIRSHRFSLSQVVIDEAAQALEVECFIAVLMGATLVLAGGTFRLFCVEVCTIMENAIL